MILVVAGKGFCWCEYCSLHTASAPLVFLTRAGRNSLVLKCWFYAVILLGFAVPMLIVFVVIAFIVVAKNNF